MRTLGRWAMRLRLIPPWLAWPLLYQGLIYVFAFPFGLLTWYGYGITLAVAAAIGLWVRPRYQITVLERSGRGTVYWVRRVNKGDKEAAEPPPSSVVLPRQ